MCVCGKFLEAIEKGEVAAVTVPTVAPLATVAPIAHVATAPGR